MINRSPWTEEEVASALDMRFRGLNHIEIGAALGRSAGAVRDMFYRRQPNQVKAADNEELRFKLNAIRGSSKLRAEIHRVFGRAA